MAVGGKIDSTPGSWVAFAMSAGAEEGDGVTRGQMV